jgi:predicted nucleic acid-binding protein
MRAVLDASAAVEIVFGRAEAARLQEVVAQADVVLAPDLFLAEVVNVIWKRHQFEGLGLTECDRALEAAIGLVDTFVSGRDLYSEAFLLARTARRSAYDMFYVALARREDAVFLTMDAALRKETERQGVRVE